MKLINRLSKISSYVLFSILSLYAYAVDLPPEAQRDIHIIQLADLLKTEQWEQAYPLFGKIEYLTEKHKLKQDSSVTFFRGEVTYHLEKYSEAEKSLTEYVKKVGNKGKYYRKSLNLLSGIEAKKLDKANYYYSRLLNTVKSKEKVDDDTKMEWLTKAAELGNHFAILDLVGIYARKYRVGSNHGISAKNYLDDQLAFKWAEELAKTEKSRADGLVFLAIFYEHGVGTEKNIEQAITFHFKAAEWNQQSSQYWLYKAYSSGKYKSVEKDNKKALSWLIKAVNNKKYKKKPDYQLELASAYDTGSLGVTDYPKAIAIYESMPDHAESQFWLYKAYSSGKYKSIEKDNKKALSWLIKAANYKIKAANYGERKKRRGYALELANTYETGSLGVTDYLKALAIYEPIYSQWYQDELDDVSETPNKYKFTSGRTSYPLLDEDYYFSLEKVALYYCEGRPGIPQDYKKAYPYAANAVASWSHFVYPPYRYISAASYCLATIYEYGRGGMTQDKKEAYYIYNRIVNNREAAVKDFKYHKGMDLSLIAQSEEALKRLEAYK